MPASPLRLHALRPVLSICRFTSIVALAIVFVCASTESCADDRPNIVMILVDDLGYGDLSPRLMPRCSQLAATGTRLNLYAHQNCMPSRAAFFTGRYPHRYGLHSVWPTPVEPGLPTDEKILSEHLQDAGYTCGMFGKWHLGWQDRAQWPSRRGFTDFVGCLGGHINCYGSQQMGLPFADGSVGHDHHRIHDLQWNEVPLYTKEYSTHLFRDSAIRFLDKHAGRPDPFFLYVPFNAPHGPFSAPREYVEAAMALGDFNESLMDTLEVHPDEILGVNPVNSVDYHNAAKLLYAAMVIALDESIDAIHQKLQAKGVADNTIFLMCSDNGVSFTIEPNTDPRVIVPVGSSAPLRGHKGSAYEAGARVANFIIWPDQIAPNQTISSNVWIGDLTATFLDVAEATMPSNLDGRTMMGAITNNSPIVRKFGARRIMPLAWKFKSSDDDRPEIVMTGQATIVNGWRKYIRNIHWDANGQQLPYVDEELYDLRIDIGETTNRVAVPAYQYLLVRSRQEFELFGGDQMLADLPTIPVAGVWAGFERTLDFGFPDGTDVLETTIP